MQYLSRHVGSPLGSEEYVTVDDFSRLPGPAERHVRSETFDLFFREGGRDQWCPDRPRRHGIDQYAPLRQRERQGTGKGDNGPLG